MHKEIVRSQIKLGKYAEALELLGKWPKSNERYFLEGTCHLHLGNYQDAEFCLRRIANKQYLSGVVDLRLGIALYGQNRLEEAINCFLPLLANGPKDDFFELALTQYGLASMELGLTSHWLTLLRRLCGDCRNKSKLIYLRGLAKLSLGDYSQGWNDHEKRLEIRSMGLNLSSLKWPIWCGETTGNESHLLLLCEQGLGDVIHFIRFAPLLRQYFRQLSIQVPLSLIRLMEVAGYFDNVFSSSDKEIGKISHCLPIMSIPHLLQLDKPSSFLPATYLRLSALELNQWQKDLQKSYKKPLIAINWQGNRQAETPYSTHRERSFSITQLEQISNLLKVRLISVQTGHDHQAIHNSLLSEALVPFQKTLDSANPDFLTTAQVLMSCDLLITNDTSLVHLGGSMGLPTWVILKCYPSWQWGDNGKSTCWYRSVRCFRQHRPFSWDGVMEEVNQALYIYLQGKIFGADT